MNYRKMFFEIRNELAKKISKKEGFINDYEVYQNILFLILEKEMEENINDQIDYETIWYSLRIDLMDAVKGIDYIYKDIYRTVLFRMIEMEHAEKGVVSETLEPSEVED